MSVMTRRPDGSLDYGSPGTITGRPGQMPVPMDPATLQRQAVVSQLDQPAAPPPQGGLPGAQPGGASPFARGGKTKQLPGMGPDLTNKVVGTGATIATTAAGAVNPVSIGTDYLGKKLKPKEEMPTFGGEFGQFTDDYGRRFEGAGPGIKGGAVRGAGYGAVAGPVGAGVGAGIGAIVGAATRNATSAFSDFSVEDAADAISQAYETYLGRPASDDEIQGNLVGQGWDPKGGDRWVGEKGLFSVLGQIRDSPEAQAFRTRGSVVDQLGTESPAPSAAQAGADPSARSSSAPAAPYQQPPLGDVGPTVTFADGSVMPLTNAQNEATLAALPKDRLQWSGNSTGEPIASDALESRAGGSGVEIPNDFPNRGPLVDTEAGGAAPSGPGGKLEGFDADKLASGHDSPKYQVARVLQKYPSTPAGLQQALAEINALGLGTASITGSKGDKLSFGGQVDPRFEGITEFDVIRGAGNGGEAWQWAPADGGGGGGSQLGAAPATASAGVVGPRSAAGQPGGDSGLMERLQAELERIIAGQPPREQIVQQLGA